MSEPDFIICLDCENPVYVFEWRNDKLHEALCTVCGNEEIDQFATQDQLEEMDEALQSHSS